MEHPGRESFNFPGADTADTRTIVNPRRSQPQPGISLPGSWTMEHKLMLHHCDRHSERLDYEKSHLLGSVALTRRNCALAIARLQTAQALCLDLDDFRQTRLLFFLDFGRVLRSDAHGMLLRRDRLQPAWVKGRMEESSQEASVQRVSATILK